MKTRITTLLATLIIATTTTAAVAAPAAQAAPAEGLGLLTWLFLGLGALIVVGQCIPAVMLFAAMLRSVFTGVATDKVPRAR